MQTPTRTARTLLLARGALAVLATLIPLAPAHAQQTFTPKAIVQWGQGGERERGMLTQMGFAQLAQGQFGLSVADLNADGRPEILVLSLPACDDAGCVVTALQSGGADQRSADLLAEGRRPACDHERNGERLQRIRSGRSSRRDHEGRCRQADRVPGWRQPHIGSRSTGREYAIQSAVLITRVNHCTGRRCRPGRSRPCTAARDPAGARSRWSTGEGQPDWRTPGAEYFPSARSRSA